MSNSFIDEILRFKGGSDVKQLWRILASDSADLRAHNLIMGIPDVGDTILYQQIISRNFQPFVRRSELISYPPKNCQFLKRAVITGIAVIDARRDGQGGEAIIEAGGVGAAFADIRINSELFRGFSFLIIITGKYFDQLLEVNEKLKEIKEELNELNNL